MADVDQSPAWYRELPTWSKTLMQLGFAGAFIAYVFIAAREDRAFFREQLAEERAAFREGLRTLTVAVEQLRADQQHIKKGVEDLRPGPFLAPPPKLKSNPSGPS